MSDIKNELHLLKQQIDTGLKQLHADELQSTLQNLQGQMAQLDFWQDNDKAQKVVKQEAKIRVQLEPWHILQKEVEDLLELSQANDDSLHPELFEQLKKCQVQYHALKHDLFFSGKYDDHDAIVRLHAGAGGTDSQDWTEMLLRMYLRWAERAGMKTEIIEQSSGEEAGLKSATISISGPYAYGKLHGEHGVHRLVRLSPFNADNLRQTSFALVEVLPQIETPEEVELDDKDLKIDVFRAGGHGGQSVNTTDSAVRITHIPTGITVSIQNERSQLQNKETALQLLRSKLAQLQIQQHKEHINELKGQTKSAEWGSQIRNYVLHPYTLVKDTRTQYEERDAQAVLDGKLDNFITAYLEKSE